jgi:integrase
MASLKQRTDGVWRARYRDVDGKEHARHFNLKRDGQAWLDQVASAVITGTYVDPGSSKLTLAGFYAAWVETQLWARGSRKIADLAMKSCSFKDVPLGKLRRSHGEAWVKAMSKTLAASTVKTRVRYVRIVARAAVLDRRLTADPLEGVKLPAIRKAEHTMRIPTSAEIRSIREAIEPAFAATIDLMAGAGLRIGEVAGLRASDFDFLRRTVHVQRQIQSYKGSHEVVDPKHGSERVVPLPDELLLRVSRHIETIGVRGSEGWLFGPPPSPNHIRHWFTKAARSVGVTDVTPHDLRHHYASGLIREGLDAVTIARAMGHASPSITLETYAHLWPDAADRTRVAAAALMASIEDSADHLRTVGAWQPLDH